MANRVDMMGSEMSKLIYSSIKKIKDPRCTEMTSVISCTVTNDLKYAKVILSIYSTDEKKRKETFNAIVRAKGFIKHDLSQQIKARTVPTLTFELDESALYSAKINTILSGLNITPASEEDDED